MEAVESLGERLRYLPFTRHSSAPYFSNEYRQSQAPIGLMIVQLSPFEYDKNMSTWACLLYTSTDRRFRCYGYTDAMLDEGSRRRWPRTALRTYCSRETRKKPELPPQRLRCIRNAPSRLAAPAAHLQSLRPHPR